MVVSVREALSGLRAYTFWGGAPQSQAAGPTLGPLTCRRQQEGEGEQEPHCGEGPGLSWCLWRGELEGGAPGPSPHQAASRHQLIPPPPQRRFKAFFSPPSPLVPTCSSCWVPISGGATVPLGTRTDPRFPCSPSGPSTCQQPLISPSPRPGPDPSLSFGLSGPLQSSTSPACSQTKVPLGFSTPRAGRPCRSLLSPPQVP